MGASTGPIVVERRVRKERTIVVEKKKTSVKVRIYCIRYVYFHRRTVSIFFLDV